MQSHSRIRDCDLYPVIQRKIKEFSRNRHAKGMWDCRKTHFPCRSPASVVILWLVCSPAARGAEVLKSSCSSSLDNRCTFTSSNHGWTRVAKQRRFILHIRNLNMIIITAPYFQVCNESTYHRAHSLSFDLKSRKHFRSFFIIVGLEHWQHKQPFSISASFLSNKRLPMLLPKLFTTHHTDLLPCFKMFSNFYSFTISCTYVVVKCLCPAARHAGKELQTTLSPSLSFIRLFYRPSQQLWQLQPWSSLACFHYILCKLWHLISLREMGFERWGTRVAKPSSPRCLIYCTCSGCEKCFCPASPLRCLVSLSLSAVDRCEPVFSFIYSGVPLVLKISCRLQNCTMIRKQLRVWSVTTWAALFWFCCCEPKKHISNIINRHFYDVKSHSNYVFMSTQEEDGDGVTVERTTKPVTAV